MIVDFTIKNYRSFKEELLFSMVAEKKKDDISNNLFNISEDGKISLLKTAVIYGANASGKSNLLTALEMIRHFVIYSDDLKLDQKIPYYEPFVLDVETKNSPVKFEIEFITSELIRYRLSIEFNSDQIISEKLTFFPDKNEKLLYERDCVGDKYSWGRDLKGKKDSLAREVMKNVLFISKSANNNDSDEKIKNVYRYFRAGIGFHTAIDSKDKSSFYTSRRLAKEKGNEFKQNVLEFIKSADVGVSSLNVKKLPVKPEEFKFPEDIPSDLKEKLMGEFSIKTDFGHKIYLNQKEVGEHYFEHEEESAGTVKMFDLAGKIIDTLQKGTVLIIDELDSSFHPLMSGYILSIFNDPVKNPRNAQLIVATHDAYLLDSEKLRRDQIWFVEKDKYGASTLYSLDEFKSEVRKNVPFDRWYLSGRFGALPLIDKKLFSVVEEKE